MSSRTNTRLGHTDVDGGLPKLCARHRMRPSQFTLKTGTLYPISPMMLLMAHRR